MIETILAITGAVCALSMVGLLCYCVVKMMRDL